MKKTLPLVVGVLILVLIAACGPSPEEIASMTAAAWTPTPVPPTPVPPTPIPTSTPVPIDLTVTVTDESGAPIEGASLAFAELGNNEVVRTDIDGKFSWTNLVGESATLKSSAQGYFDTDQSATLQRGLNDVSITLKRDPFGLMPSEACAAGERLLYAEDFQDQRAQGWNEIDLKVPGWNMAPSAEESGNSVLSAQYAEMAGEGINSRLTQMTFDNAVWRTRFLISKPFASDKNWFSFNWKQNLESFDLNGQQIFDSRYQIPLGINYFALRRLQQPVTNIGIGQVKGVEIGKWHLTEISTFQGVTEVWLDGMRLMSYTDPQPIPAGTISLELWLKGSDTIVYFDNMSVCELSAPFTSIAPAVP